MERLWTPAFAGVTYAKTLDFSLVLGSQVRNSDGWIELEAVQRSCTGKTMSTRPVASQPSQSQRQYRHSLELVKHDNRF